MFREMRRFKQALTQSENELILKNGKTGILALCDGDYPYAVPLNYWYEQDKIYFHSAKSGQKIEMIQKSDKASFCVIDQDRIIKEEYTDYFRSVIAFGRIKIIDDENEKYQAIDNMAKKYYPEDHEANRKAAIKRDYQGLLMLRMDIDHLSGKEAIELVRNKEKRMDSK